jgi:hypothetical protein
MDRLERLAFNALPAALWPDVTANVYHHCSNQIDATGSQYSYDLYFCCTANVHQGWPKFVMSAVQIKAASPAASSPTAMDARCTSTDKYDAHVQQEAQEEHQQGASVSAGARGSAIVVSGYAPTTSTFAHPDSAVNGDVTITISGQYPFSDDVTITVTVASADTVSDTIGEGRVMPPATTPATTPAMNPATIPVQLLLRVPCWCEGASASTKSGTSSDTSSGTNSSTNPSTVENTDSASSDAAIVTTTGAPCTFMPVSLSVPMVSSAPNSIAEGGSVVKLHFTNKIRFYTWVNTSTVDGQAQINAGSTEVHYGPLTFAIRPPSIANATVVNAAFPKIKSRKVKATADAAWNYGLLLDSLAVQWANTSIGSVPFCTGDDGLLGDASCKSPVTIVGKGRRVPEWKTAGGARGVAPPPRSPLESKEPLEDIVLVPYGSTNVRISVFPQLSS